MEPESSLLGSPFVLKLGGLWHVLGVTCKLRADRRQPHRGARWFLRGVTMSYCL